MNPSRLRSTALLGALCLVGCGGADLTINLVPRSNSGVTGVALFFNKDPDVEVQIDVEGGTDNNDQPAFINTGTCSPLGQFSGAPLEILEPVVEGKSTTYITGRRLSDLRNTPYHIDVQNSADPSLVNACGDIS